MKKALITGPTGQDGSYLTELLLEKGYEVHGLIRRASTFNTGRINHLVNNPDINNKSLFLHFGDLSDGSNLTNLLYNVQPDEIYNLGAQSHVRVSFDCPEYTGDVDGLGTVRLLEAVRNSGIARTARFYQAASSEMFGKVQSIPQTESTPFYPRSPYGCAKVYAHWLTVNYRESYGLHASNGILFNHECLTASTPILYRRNGFVDIKPIGELVSHRTNPARCKVYQSTPNLEIWDGGRWAKVTAATATWNDVDSDKQVHRVCAGGAYYEATGNHLSFLDGKEEIKTSELQPGQLLQLFSLPGQIGETSLSAEEAEFIGMMIADGYVSESGHARFTKNDDALRQRASYLWLTLTGGSSTEQRNPGGFENSGEVRSVNFTGCSAYAKYLRSEIYCEDRKKRVPLRVLNAPRKEVEVFLSAYNACDGLKGGNQKTEFKSFTTDSAVLAQGLYYLFSRLAYDLTICPEERGEAVYFHINILSPGSTKGQHLRKPSALIRKVSKIAYVGWVFDLATESGTFSAGVGRGWVHNSPRRGETFVTRKITRAATRIRLGLQNELVLGNLDARRDWGYAKEYVEMMWQMLQQDTPDDYVVATNETHSIREFLDEAFGLLNLDWKQYVKHDERYERPAEVDLLIGDPAKAKAKFGWEPKVRFKELVRIMVEADRELAFREAAGTGGTLINSRIP